ncbi:MAG: heparan-alpha-glucosaminide N-acetyltransferase domain-containing protein [Ignavibacteriales bacterium]|nr:heparan-alpha-glucosaminide N-acetyltransferase domain-containing protein [Ignavibacteriales bacterium]
MAAPAKNRLAFIDLLRGWALIVMIEVHVFNTFILPVLKTTPWYHILNFINGLVAPSFTFISGFVFVLASQRKLESFRTYGSAFWKQLGRIGLVWGTGYFLHLPFFSFRRIMSDTTQEGWLNFYQADVLHCIAFGLLVLFITRLFIKNGRTYRTFLFTSGLFVVFTTIFVWNYDFLNLIPAPISAYINGLHYSLFPLFPWLAFMLFGGYFASRYIDAREQKKEQEFILRFAFEGALLFVACMIGMELQSGMRILPIDIRANPLFFFERLGIVMLLLTACWFYADYRKTEKSFVLDVGRESLMVYAAHLLVIYGRFWNERSLDFYYGKTFNVTECMISTLTLILVMSGAAIAWGWMKRNHLPLARLLFFMFAVTTTAMFLIR